MGSNILTSVTEVVHSRIKAVDRETSIKKDKTFLNLRTRHRNNGFLNCARTWEDVRAIRVGDRLVQVSSDDTSLAGCQVLPQLRTSDFDPLASSCPT